MTNNLIIFDDSELRIVMCDGEPWWVLNDVCALLDIANPRDTANRLEGYQKGVAKYDTLGGPQDVTIINEAGIYAVTLASRKASAKAFAKWLFTEVLPSIRRYGAYSPAQSTKSEHLVSPARSTPTMSAEGDRLLAELAQYEARTGYSRFDIPGISKQRLKTIEMGASVSEALNRNRLWHYLLSAGIDLHYVIYGEPWTANFQRKTLHNEATNPLLSHSGL